VRRKPLLLVTILLLLASGATAVPLTDRISAAVNGQQIVEAGPNSNYQFTVTNQSLDLSKPSLGFFSSITGSQDTKLKDREVLPGDDVEICSEVRLSSDSLDRGTLVYGYSMYAAIDGLNLDKEKQLGTGSAAEGDDVVYWVDTYVERCHDFTAPSTPGTYTVNLWTNVEPGGMFLGARDLTVVADSDGDGVQDSNDNCPSTEGDDDFNGCPDTDRDDIPDRRDDCPNQDGLEELNGCPNAEPSVSSIQTRDTVVVNETVRASLTASDPDGHTLSYSWNNGESGPSTDFTFKSTGKKTVSVDVTDSYTAVSRIAEIEVIPSETGGTDPANGGDKDTDSGDGGTQPRTELGPFEQLFYGVIDFIGGVL